MRLFRRLFILLASLVLLALLLLTLFNIALSSLFKAQIHSNPREIPLSQVALIPGASVIGGKKPSGILLERLEKGVELYRLNRVQKLLLSGDNAGAYYDEVNVMKDFCLKKGIKPDDIFLDHSGLRTLDSVYRSKDIFEAREIVVVSQKLYLPRALFLAQQYNISASGYLADSDRVQITKSMMVREFLARYLAILDVYLFHSRPTFMGEKTPLTGSGQSTWNKPQ